MDVYKKHEYILKLIKHTFLLECPMRALGLLTEDMRMHLVD
jgi:hypothetical protein